MSKEIEKILEIIEFIEKGGTDALFEVVEELKVLKDRINSLENQDDLSTIILEINALRSKIDDIKPVDVDTQLTKLKEELITLIPEIPEQKDYTNTIQEIKSKLKEVSEKKDIVEIKETVIEREIIPEEKIKEIEERLEQKVPVLDDEKLKSQILKHIPKQPPQYAGGSGATFLKSMRDVDISGRNTTKAYLKWNPTTKKYEHVELATGSSISVDTAEVTDPDFTDGTDIVFDATGSIVTASFADRTGHSVLGVSGGASAPPTPIALGDHSVVGRNGGNVETINAGNNTVLLRKTGNTLGFDKVTETELSTSVNASLDLADSSTQPGDNISDFTNDAGYLTSVATADIDDDAVTNAKLANMNDQTIKGNVSGGSANPTDLTASQVNKMLDTGASITERYVKYTNAIGTSVYKIAGSEGSSVLGTLALSANIIYLIKVCVQKGWTIGRFGVNITTGGTANNFRIGVWQCDSEGLPSTLAVDSGTVAFTGTGVKGVTLSEKLSAGEYCFGIVLDGTATLRSVQFSQPIGLDSAMGTVYYKHFRYGFTFGTLGNLTTSSLTFSTGTYPAIGIGLS